MRLKMLLAAMAAVAVCTAKDIKTVVLKTTPEMHCNSCENRIKEGLRFEKGVKDIKTDLADKTVTVVYDADKTNEEKIVAALGKINYKAVAADKTQAATETKKRCCGGNCCCGKKAAAADSIKAEVQDGAAQNAAAAALSVARFKASQISCGGCAGKVKKLLGGVDGVNDVQVDLETKVVTVDYDAAKTNPAAFVEAFKTINYEVETLN